MVWTIDGKEVIQLGDSTTHGGKVITASSGVFYDGIPIARVGDSVTCPLCKGVYTITSGAPSAFDHEVQIARNGDSVSCGAKLIAGSAAATSRAQSAPSAGSDPSLVSQEDANAMPEPSPMAVTEEKQKRLIYAPHTETFEDSSFALIPKGDGLILDFPPAAASFRITATASVEGRKLSVFAYGSTALVAQPEPPLVHFWAKAIIMKGDKKIGEQTFERDEGGYILPDRPREQIIGEVNFILPEPKDKTPLTLIVEGSYMAKFGEGMAAPMGSTAKARHQLPIVEAE